MLDDRKGRFRLALSGDEPVVLLRIVIVSPLVVGREGAIPPIARVAGIVVVFPPLVRKFHHDAASRIRSSQCLPRARQDRALFLLAGLQRVHPEFRNDQRFVGRNGSKNSTHIAVVPECHDLRRPEGIHVETREIEELKIEVFRRDPVRMTDRVGRIDGLDVVIQPRECSGDDIRSFRVEHGRGHFIAENPAEYCRLRAQRLDAREDLLTRDVIQRQSRPVNRERVQHPQVVRLGQVEDVVRRIEHQNRVRAQRAQLRQIATDRRPVGIGILFARTRAWSPRAIMHAFDEEGAAVDIQVFSADLDCPGGGRAVSDSRCEHGDQDDHEGGRCRRGESVTALHLPVPVVVVPATETRREEKLAGEQVRGWHPQQLGEQPERHGQEEDTEDGFGTQGRLARVVARDIGRDPRASAVSHTIPQTARTDKISRAVREPK